MKKFKFSLDGVLSYKQQILDALKGEHALILGEVHAQEEHLANCWARYRDYNEEYCRRSKVGMSVTDALICQSSLRRVRVASIRLNPEKARLMSF